MFMWDNVKIRVRYAETDQMGIVHHSNYYVWFEFGRSEFCRTRGFSYQEMEAEDGLMMVVAETNCRYVAPAKYDELITVRTRISDLRSRGLTFEYEIFREADDKRLAFGTTKHVITDSNKRVTRLPEKYVNLLQL
ncbi:MAG: acyl-CoA thioesterase [Pyrinomonadaceae bacterium]